MVVLMKMAVAFFFSAAMLVAQSQPAGSHQYTGPGSCASPSCHGAVVPRTSTSVQQNEYSTWVIQDKHAQAYAVLSNPVSVRIAQILNIPDASKDARCLNCHSLNVAPQQRARPFDTSDGVSCENCHGPAADWLGEHTRQGWTHQQSVERGMTDLRDLTARTEVCLSCHLGTAEKFVDHELIAAGHPDLYFELASFSAVMPRHWKPKQDESPWREVSELAIGQATQLREQLARLERNANSGPWPQYADLDCFACHHSLTAAQDSWYLKRGYEGRPPGNPPWNIARFVVLKHIGRELDSAATQQLQTAINNLYRMVSTIGTDRRQVATEAARVRTMAAALEQRARTASYDAALTRRLMKAIAGDGDYISRQGERAAEQAAMALDALYITYARNTNATNDQALRDAIKGLFDRVQNPSAYNAFNFAQQMQVVNGLLP